MQNIKWYYLIMDRFGKSLKQVHDSFYGKFTFKTTVQIGIQILTILEEVHRYGFVFNDLKPDNLLIGNATKNKHHFNSIIDNDLNDIFYFHDEG